ncbi:MAG: FecR domain-containing protein [Pseudomonadota bacterium]
MTRQFSPELRRISLEAHEWLASLEETPISPEIKAEFEQWLAQDIRHRQEYKKAQISVAATQTLDINDFLRYQPTSRLMLFRSYAMEAIDFITDRKGLVGSAIVAVLVLTVFVGINQYQTNPDSVAPNLAFYESDIGKLKTITLADGTAVTLGARSSIETAFYPDKRIVVLTNGKAYFDVVSDSHRPFMVKTANLTVWAVGTAFDVRNNVETLRVGVTEGEVEVKYPLIVNGKEVGITDARSVFAGQEIAATNNSGLSNVQDANQAFLAAWRSQRLVYQNVSIAELVVDLNRYSETPIAIDPSNSVIPTLTFGGVFPDTNTDAVLEMVADIHPIKIDRTNPKLTILRNK